MIARRTPALAALLGLAAGLGAVATAGSPAAAEPAAVESGDAGDLLASAAAAFRALHYDQALLLADQAWSRGTSDPAQLRRIFAIAGRAAASIGDGDAARTWFSRWLALDPAAALPGGTSPKIIALLRDARGALDGAQITGRATARPGGITITVTGDPLGLARGVRAGATSLALRDHTARLAAPAAGVDLELVDRYGNTLARVSVAPQVSAAEKDADPATRAGGSTDAGDRSPHDTPWFARTSTWEITSGSLAVVGGAALWVAFDARAQRRKLDADSSHHSISVPRALDDRMHNAQIVSGIAFTGAALAAITTTWLWIHSRGEPSVGVSARGVDVGWRASF